MNEHFDHFLEEHTCGSIACLDPLNRIKYTDSTLGFGKKIIWERPIA